VTVRETLDGGILRIFHQQDRIAEHPLAVGKGAMVTVAAHYGNLPRRERARLIPAQESVRELVPGPGVGLRHAVL
jgi:hypothetical protein